MEDQTNQSEDQWQEIELIIGWVLRREIRGCFALISKTRIVNRAETGQPVTAHIVTMSLNIVLPPCEIPHEIAPIHPVHLIAHKVLHVLTKGRKSLTVVTFLCWSAVIRIIARPLDVTVHALFFRTPVHTWEESCLSIRWNGIHTLGSIRFEVFFFDRTSIFFSVFLRILFMLEGFYHHIPFRYNETTQVERRAAAKQFRLVLS